MTYEYKCEDCKHTWEEQQPITAEPITVCPKCQKETAKRQISKGGTFILSGNCWANNGYTK